MPQSERIFKKLFEESAIAQFTPTELKAYEDSLKAYRDIKNSIDTAREEGLEQGRAEGRAEGREEGFAIVVKKMLAAGMDTKSIAQMTGFPTHEIERLLNHTTQQD